MELLLWLFISHLATALIGFTMGARWAGRTAMEHIDNMFGAPDPAAGMTPPTDINERG